MTTTPINAKIIAAIAEGFIIDTRENPESARQITGIDIISHHRMTVPESGETLRRSRVQVIVGESAFQLVIDSTEGGKFVGFTPQVSRDYPLGSQTTAAYAIDSACEELARLNK